MFQGGENDGFAKESFTGLIDGGNLASLYYGGNSDGFSKNDVQYIWTSPSCTFVVNTDDSGFGSLRYAINCAEYGDTIHFSPLLHDVSIQLTSGPIFMFQDLYVDANPLANLTVDGSYLPFTIATGLDGFSEITIKGLNVMSGSDLFGNGIVNGGILILEDLEITDFTNASESLILTFPGSNLIIKGNVRLKLNY